MTGRWWAWVGFAVSWQVNQTVYKIDSDMYRTWHEPMLASMGMQKAILCNTCDV